MPRILGIPVSPTPHDDSLVLAGVTGPILTDRSAHVPTSTSSTVATCPEPADLLGSGPPSLTGADLVRVSERWGSPARYLLEHGLEPEDLLALGRGLLPGEE